MKSPIKKAIHDKFQELQLSEDKLDELMTLQSQIKTRQTANQINSKGLAVAALFIITMSFIAVSSFKYKNMATAIANEVSHNHFKLKPLEVESNILDNINAYFTKLDFKPISSSLLKDKKLTLLGARYCSESGELITFYEAPYDEKIYSVVPDIGKGEEPITSYSKGVGVKIWVEKGILMAMTF